MLDDLADYTRNIEVQVVEGNKVIEVRNAGLHKGAIALEWLAETEHDFILAIGDDWTDEDLFKSLPDYAYSIRIGLENTSARFRIVNPMLVRQILRDLVESAGSAPA
jgi:trehalose 6-phosphate synthase/phosphatase